MNNALRLLVAVTALGLAGCTSPGTPVPSQTSTSAASTTSSASGSSSNSANGAPRVANPLDVTKFIAKPCALLTASQVASLGLTGSGNPQTASSGNEMCSWHSADDREDYTISFLPNNKGGLSDNYRANKDGQWAYFEPTEVADYPAVFNDIGDRRDRGSCTIVTGVRDELTFRVASARTPNQKGCEKVKEIAGQVITTLKAGV
jgi:hypothetical protein